MNELRGGFCDFAVFFFFFLFRGGGGVLLALLTSYSVIFFARVSLGFL